MDQCCQSQRSSFKHAAQACLLGRTQPTGRSTRCGGCSKQSGIRQGTQLRQPQPRSASQVPCHLQAGRLVWMVGSCQSQPRSERTLRRHGQHHGKGTRDNSKAGWGGARVGGVDAIGARGERERRDRRVVQRTHQCMLDQSNSASLTHHCRIILLS